MFVVGLQVYGRREVTTEKRRKRKQEERDGPTPKIKEKRNHWNDKEKLSLFCDDD